MACVSLSLSSSREWQRKLDEQTITDRVDSGRTPSDASLLEIYSSSNEALLSRLDEALGQTCAVVDPSSGTVRRLSSSWPHIDLFRWLPLCHHVSRLQKPEVIEDHAPLMLLALPLEVGEFERPRVAIALVVTDLVRSISNVESAAKIFGLDTESLYSWASKQRVLNPGTTLKLIDSVFSNHRLSTKVDNQQDRISDISSRLITTFEELNLLHRLTELLSLDHSVRDISKEVIGWLAEIIPTKCLIINWITQESENNIPSQRDRIEGRTIVAGVSPIEISELDSFYEHLGPEASYRPMLHDQVTTASPAWRYPKIDQAITVPIRTSDQFYGWIGVLNYEQNSNNRDNELGKTHTSLLTSVANILSIHAGNRVLFHRKEVLLDSAVRAITSAIDAKDSYTRGHSDRVARIAVCLAKQLGCTQEEQNSIYMGGLLHDVGKIGIDDTILRKPGRLTEEEFDHIKSHPLLGARIVEEVEELQHVLPIVLYHHEAWDGSGYPEGLVAQSCPTPARIMAVADAIDAMGSDRPYRKGMPFSKINEILQDGSGKQWDPEVVAAYFEVKGRIEAIATSGKKYNDPVEEQVIEG